MNRRPAAPALAATLALAMGTLTAALPAAAQSGGPPNPFAYSCGELLAAESPQEKAVVNFMVYWSVGYLHGRLGGIESLSLDGEHHDGSVNEVLGALNRICPNVPEMPIASFMDNLAGDIEKQAAQ